MALGTSGISFDPIPHRYFDDDGDYVSVTRVIEEAGLKPAFYRSGPVYKQRGDAVHLATEDIALGSYDETNYADEIHPYANAMRKFKERYTYVPEYIELTVGSRILRVAGRIDHIGTVLIHGQRKRWLVDIKSGTMPVPYVGVQAAGYDILRRSYAATPDGTYHDLSRITIDSRVCVLLKDNGDFDLSTFDGPKWTNAFNAAVCLYQLKRQHGLLSRSR